MTTLTAGPLTGDAIAAASSSTVFGGGEIDNVSVFPLTAAPGTPAVTTWTWAQLLQGYFTNIGEPLPSDPSTLEIPEPHFYSYQLQTFLGLGVPKTVISTVPMYCRIAAREDYYLISYFGFFAYNGGIGATSTYTSRPLDIGCGWMAHIGDWTRLTAKVKIAQNLVSLYYVDYEAHGDPNIVTSGAFSNLTLDQITPLVAYCAWHSHEMYPTVGVHPRPSVGFTANDYTDDKGVVWNSGANLTFISDDGPSWVRYNGLWGANMEVPGIPVEYLKNGPQGPAFHWYWISETKDGTTPITQWRPGMAPQLPPPPWSGWSPPPQTYVYPGETLTLKWWPAPGASSYSCTIRRDGYPVSVAEVRNCSQRYLLTNADMYHNLTAEVSALSSAAAPSAPAHPVTFYCGNQYG